jgi:FkbM family methyltransferase
MKTDEESKSTLYFYLRGIKPLRSVVRFVQFFIYRSLHIDLYQIWVLPRCSRKIGFFQALRLIFRAWFGRSEFQISVPGIAHPVWIRPRTSDVDVFDHIFIGEAYDLPFAIRARLILDLGANVGYASVYFAKRCPDARIVAVEPEHSNFQALAKNTEPYSNVITIEAAIWPRAEQLAVDNSGSEQGFQVTAKGTARMPSVNGITIDDVLKRWGGGAPVDLLKIDIEGAEKELFSAPCDSWLARTRMIAIELHDRMLPGCEQALEQATRNYRFLKMTKGEDTILVRND